MAFIISAQAIVPNATVSSSRSSTLCLHGRLRSGTWNNSLPINRLSSKCSTFTGVQRQLSTLTYKPSRVSFVDVKEAFGIVRASVADRPTVNPGGDHAAENGSSKSHVHQEPFPKGRNDPNRPQIPSDIVLRVARNVPRNDRYTDVTRRIIKMATDADGLSKVAGAMIFCFLVDPLSALAAEEKEVVLPVFTPLFEGAGRFIHPVLMGSIFIGSLYAGYLGWKSRETRTATPEVRKALIKGKYGDRHYKLGSALQALMVFGTALGMLVTYNNDGQLYPGAHLYAGIGLAVLFSIAGAFAPYMKEGKEWARNGHIAVNTAALGVFLWEVGTGLDIVKYFLENP